MAPVSRTELGNYIREARERKGISARELGRRTDIDSAAISRMERGETVPRYAVDRLARIADELGLDSYNLYEMAGYPMSSNLPDLPAYLKAKYKLPEGAVDDMAEYLKILEAEYKVKPDTED